ncbi:MAG: hypothetical protein FWB72_02495 [Firmicutes bacterium]|nr:hypothetical protein [Bacillota bacterium]
MNNHLVYIQNDLFDVSSRIKEIDSGYFVVYNARESRYEVHHSGQYGNTLALVVPYSKLDARTILLTNKSRVENKARLLKEMQKHNEQLGYFE